MVNMSQQNIYYMKYALEEAKKAFELGEVPIGAVIVYENKIIASAHNLVETKKDATAHAEVLCIQKASKILSNWRLKNATLFVTIEPCVMCAGALYLSRIKKVVWGAPDIRHGGFGSWVDLKEKKHPTHFLETEGGVLLDECKKIIVDFFALRRKDGKNV